jgi:hypothetical protein
MSSAFQYKPKFKDIRIKPPVEGEDDHLHDVHALKPGEVQCDWPSCRQAGESRAPKSRDMPNEHYWFCRPHAAEYNKNWNYFQGMSEGEIASRLEEERQTGGRPTWSFKASNNSREAAAKMSKGSFFDTFGFFGAPKGKDDPLPANDRRIGKIERRALADMDLEPGASAEQIRTRYTELIKRLHPDSNGGDRSMEDKLTRVIRAYKALKSAKFV